MIQLKLDLKILGFEPGKRLKIYFEHFLWWFCDDFKVKPLLILEIFKNKRKQNYLKMIFIWKNLSHLRKNISLEQPGIEPGFSGLEPDVLAFELRPLLISDRGCRFKMISLELNSKIWYPNLGNMQRFIFERFSSTLCWVHSRNFVNFWIDFLQKWKWKLRHKTIEITKIKLQMFFFKQQLFD